MKQLGNNRKNLTFALAALVLACGLLFARTASAAAIRTLSFNGPTEAFDYMVKNLRSLNARHEMDEIFGEDAVEILGVEPLDGGTGLEAFLEAYGEYHAVEVHDGNEAYLAVGRNLWVFPVPVVMRDGKWQFDTEKGLRELNARRIGRNERFAIQASLAYVDAQRDYFEMNPMRVQGSEYAQHITSHPGRHDGLYWAAAGGGRNRSPLGKAFAQAAVDKEQERAMETSKSHGGYHYKILHMQGPGAVGGARSYVENDRMTGGFALLAYPSVYNKTGVMSFIVNQDGLIYEKNLGRETEKLAQAMTAYDPDRTWKLVSKIHTERRPEPVKK